MTTRSIQVAALIAITALVSIADANAREFGRRHPRRAEVNRRLRHQERRIQKGVESGKLSPEEASQLRSQEAAIKQKEIQEVRANGGHLTRDQKKELNQELNAQSKEIYQDKHN